MFFLHGGAGPSLQVGPEVHGAGVALSRGRHDLEAGEPDGGAVGLQFRAPGTDVVAPMGAVGVGGGDHVVDPTEGIGGVARTHQPLGAGRGPPTMQRPAAVAQGATRATGARAAALHWYITPHLPSFFIS